jgi:hypothetical protein
MASLAACVMTRIAAADNLVRRRKEVRNEESEEMHIA